MNDDLIRRSDAIKTVNAFLGTDLIVERIKRLPSADRPQGEWEYNGFGSKCSECGFSLVGGEYRFCPNCGARMKGADDEKV